MCEKNERSSKNLGYRLRLSGEEFDMLHRCSRHAHMKTSDFLRMIVDNYAISNGIIGDESIEYYTHDDNQFEVVETVEAAKQKLIEATDIEDNSEEIHILYSILFYFYQMGWLDQFLENVEQYSKND